MKKAKRRPMMPVRTYSVPLDFEPPLIPRIAVQESSRPERTLGTLVTGRSLEDTRYSRDGPLIPRSSSVAQGAANQEHLEAETEGQMRETIAAVRAARAANKPVQIAVVSGRDQRKPAMTGLEAMFQEELEF